MRFLVNFLRNESRHLWLRSPQLKIWRVFSLGILFATIFVLSQTELSPQIQQTFIYVVLYTCCLIYAIMAHPNVAEKQHSTIVQLYFRNNKLHTYIGCLLSHWVFLSAHLVFMWNAGLYLLNAETTQLTHSNILLLSLGFYIAALRQLFSEHLMAYQNFLQGFLVLPLTIPLLILGIIHLNTPPAETSAALILSFGTNIILLGLSLFMQDITGTKA